MSTTDVSNLHLSISEEAEKRRSVGRWGVSAGARSAWRGTHTLTPILNCGETAPASGVGLEVGRGRSASSAGSQPVLTLDRFRCSHLRTAAA